MASSSSRAFPATILVHTPQGVEPCCDTHAGALARLMGICGAHSYAEPAPAGAECNNCRNTAPKLKAYQLNDEEVWTGYTAEGAVAAAIAETGVSDGYALEDARELTDEELDQPFAYSEHPEVTETTTLREELAQMSEPGLLAATDL